MKEDLAFACFHWFWYVEFS